MTERLVIVRADRGEALKRVEISKGYGKIYVASERGVEAVRRGDLPAIGFPQEDVFERDDSVFESIRQTGEWKIARPYSESRGN